MPHTAAAQHSPSAVHTRPKGILKNSNSFSNVSPDVAMTSPSLRSVDSNAIVDSPAAPAERPGVHRELSEKEIVQKNTEINAGDRRTSSSAHSHGTNSRRHSEQGHPTTDQAEHERRLKWDEANLYLNEGQMGGKMKIDEPKTPYAKQYDPSEDDAEISALNAQDLNVDELDMEKKSSRRRESEIPGLDLGEPEMERKVDLHRETSDGERSVALMDVDDDGGHHGEDEANMTGEELEKHRKFEQMRKKHYEMKNIKSLLGHSEDLDVEDEQ